MLESVADALIAAKDTLTEVDGKIGDGDHGIGMETGARKIKESLGKDYASINDIYRAAGMSMINTMGGASGIIFGSMFLYILKDSEPKTQMTVREFAQQSRASLEAIKQRGKAVPGDKTMVDAYEPAVVALEGYAGDDFEGAFAAAAAAANEGVEATKNYVAKFGRAKTLGERAIGFQDAGATSVAIIFGAMRDWAAAQ